MSPELARGGQPPKSTLRLRLLSSCPPLHSLGWGSLRPFSPGRSLRADSSFCGAEPRDSDGGHIVGLSGLSLPLTSSRIICHRDCAISSWRVHERSGSPPAIAFWALRNSGIDRLR